MGVETLHNLFYMVRRISYKRVEIINFFRRTLNSVKVGTMSILATTTFPDVQFSSVQSLSYVRLFVTPWTAAHQASLSITNSRSLLTHVQRVHDAIQPSHPRWSPSPPALTPSQHQSLFQ